MLKRSLDDKIDDPIPLLPIRGIRAQSDQPIETEQSGEDEVIAKRVDPPVGRTVAHELSVAEDGAEELSPVEAEQQAKSVFKTASLKRAPAVTETKPQPEMIEEESPLLSARLRRIARNQGFNPLPLESMSLDAPEQD